MPSQFSPARQLGISAKPYQSYWDDDGTGVPAAEIQAPQPQLVGGDMMISPFNPLREEVIDEDYNAQLAAHDAQREIASGQTDWANPDAQGKLRNWIASGAVAPQAARAIMATIPRQGSHAQNRYSKVPVEVATAASALRQIDPNDPGAMTQLKGVVSNHDLAPPDVQTHPHFDAEFKSLRRAIDAATLRRNLSAQHDPEEKLINEAMASGLTPDELQSHLDEDGKVANKVGLRAAMYQAKHNSLVLSSGAGKRLEELGFNAAKPPSDPEKEEWLRTNGIEPTKATPQQWNAAWHGVKSRHTSAYNDYLNFLGERGYKKLPRASSEAPPAAPLPSVAGPNDKQVQLLMQNPSLATQFNAKFGAGAAEKILGQ